MPLQRLESLSEIASQTWDALVPENQPFLRHAFLSALEDSGSVGPHSGWQPEHLLHIEGDRLIAALPSYRKWHSYGEYVFDHAWADACERAGIDYYPKLLTAVPFSPVSGPRLLAASARGRFRTAEKPAGLPGNRTALQCPHQLHRPVHRRGLGRAAGLVAANRLSVPLAESRLSGFSGLPRRPQFAQAQADAQGTRASGGAGH